MQGLLVKSDGPLYRNNMKEKYAFAETELNHIAQTLGELMSQSSPSIAADLIEIKSAVDRRDLMAAPLYIQLLPADYVLRGELDKIRNLILDVLFHQQLIANELNIMETVEEMKERALLHKMRDTETCH